MLQNTADLYSLNVTGASGSGQLTVPRGAAFSAVHPGRFTVAVAGTISGSGVWTLQWSPDNGTTKLAVNLTATLDSVGLKEAFDFPAGTLWASYASGGAGDDTTIYVGVSRHE